MLEPVLRGPRLLGGDPPDVVVPDPDVRVELGVGERVVAHHVLLLPHEAGGPHHVQRAADRVPEPLALAVRAVVGVVLDGDPDLRLAHPEQHRAQEGPGVGCRRVEGPGVGQEQPAEDAGRLDVHGDREPGVQPVVLEVPLHPLLQHTVELPLPHVGLVLDLLEGPALPHALQLPDVELLQDLQKVVVAG